MFNQSDNIRTALKTAQVLHFTSDYGMIYEGGIIK